MKTEKTFSAAWIYCFRRGDEFVFLDRKDRVIETFKTYKEAEDFANKNIHLIDRKIKRDVKNRSNTSDV